MIDRNRRRQDYRRALGGEAGRRVLRDLMRRRFVVRSTQSAGDSHETAFNEGRRAVVLDVMHAVRVDEDAVRELLAAGVGEEWGWRHRSWPSAVSHWPSLRHRAREAVRLAH